MQILFRWNTMKIHRGFFCINCWNKLWSKSISEDTEQAKKACLFTDSSSLSIMKDRGIFLITIQWLKQVKNDLKLKIFSFFILFEALNVFEHLFSVCKDVHFHGVFNFFLSIRVYSIYFFRLKGFTQSVHD